MREIDHDTTQWVCVCVQSAALMFCKLYAVLLYGESAIMHQRSVRSRRSAVKNRLPQETQRPHGEHFYAVRPRAALRP